MDVEGGRDVDDLPKNSANHTALTPLWFLDRAAQVHPNRKSVIYGSKQYTWLETYQRCRRLASALSRRSIGIGKTESLEDSTVRQAKEFNWQALLTDQIL